MLSSSRKSIKYKFYSIWSDPIGTRTHRFATVKNKMLQWVYFWWVTASKLPLRAQSLILWYMYQNYQWEHKVWYCGTCTKTTMWEHKVWYCGTCTKTTIKSTKSDIVVHVPKLPFESTKSDTVVHVPKLPLRAQSLILWYMYQNYHVRAQSLILWYMYQNYHWEHKVWYCGTCTNKYYLSSWCENLKGKIYDTNL